MVFDRYDVWTKSFYAAITGVAQDSILNKKQIIIMASEMADLALQAIEQKVRDGAFVVSTHVDPMNPPVPYHKAVIPDKSNGSADECDD